MTKKANCAVCGNNYECGSGDCYQGNCRPIVSYACTTDASCCSSGTDLYCSKVDPKTGASVGPRCCDSNPAEWWNPFAPGTNKCTQIATCNPECQSNPFAPNCLLSGNTGGCCDFMTILTEKLITTY